MRIIKSRSILICFFFQCIQVWGQEIAVDRWKAHLPNNHVVSIAEVGDKIYCATGLALFSYDKSDNSLETYSKATGLSDIGISAIKYSSTYDILLIAYDNTNIDLVVGNSIYNISDIKRKSIVGEKSINDIFFIGNLAYLSCGFGIVVLDINKREIKDTYYIGAGGGAIKIYDLTSDGLSLFAATEEGIKEGLLSDPNLANFSSWYTHGVIDSLPSGACKKITYFSNNLYASLSDTLFYYNDTIWKKLFYNDNWKIRTLNTCYNNVVISEVYEPGSIITDARLTFIDINQSVSYIQNPGYIVRPLDAIKDNEGIVWSAEEWKGLIKYNGGNFEVIYPNGPGTIDVTKMAVYDGQLWIAPGSVDGAWNYLYNGVGFFSYINDYWVTYAGWGYSSLDSILDFISVAINPSNKHIYLGSFGGGLVEFHNENIVNIYKQNSTLQEAIGDNNSYRVSGLAFDENDNLWISNYGAALPISVKKAGGTWKAFNVPITWSANAISQVIIDDYDQKWFLLPKGQGMLVFNHGADIDNTGDDQYKKLSKGEGNGNLPSLDILCAAKDLEGDIWVGTVTGIAIFYCAGQVFSSDGCDAQQILVDQGGYLGYLLESEWITSIAIDGANRKWIGSRNGVWLMSEDGTEEVFRFTADNSPLLSDVIINIAIDHETGEVFFATERGMISFKGTATMGGEVHENVYVYPNPVREDYNGLIAVRGLVQNAKVKITDIIGNLIYQTEALGGQAIWDGNNYNGERAKTGVYLVFSTNDDGSETYVTKFLIIN